MEANPIIGAPSGTVVEHALSFGARGGAAMPVSVDNPLPVSSRPVASGVAPLAGTTASGVTVGPYLPRLGRAIMLTLTGTWSGSAQLLRSIDGGVTRQPLTVGGQGWASFSANCNEAVAEEYEAGASYYLALAPVSGTIAYRVAQ